MTSTSAFSSEDDVTKKHVEIESKSATEASRLPEVYELERCSQWIQANGHTRTALQFPDDLLVDSVPVQRHLQDFMAPGTSVFILGDTSYGSCCVDEVAAEHYQADSIIHYGPTCLSPTQRLPVLYVLCNQPVDVTHAAGQLSVLLSDPASRVILIADTMYQHALESLAEQLKQTCNNVITSNLKMPCSEGNREDSPSIESVQDTVSADGDQDAERDSCRYCKCNRHFTLQKGHNLEDYSVVFLGEEGKLLTNLMMTMNKCRFLSYNPETRTARQETLKVNRELMKRFYMIERAKDARIVGILAGTLGVSRTRDVITHLKTLVKNAGKKSYTFVVGKLNVAKLANFLEVDVFVLVACQQNTLMDSKEFLKPVVTPFEMEVACNQARQWTGDYITDFAQLLPGAAEHVPPVAPETDMADVSLISNKLRSMGQRSEVDGFEGSSAVMLRSDNMAVSNLSADNAGEFLASRSWQGLDRKLGQTPVEKAKDGRSGIAMGYQSEPQ
ncbi:2-(3-amino-3-carboxypropyl)histidine synthase subunit 2-like [Littorina saxatilis]|uniref:2-(3-amino-3-carboxypropyl)histidine synthase subunit 2 n=1 Tax=Littorina saxatilis TaxID=31220 RepID=A0AAN9B726_9CAEN